MVMFMDMVFVVVTCMVMSEVESFLMHAFGCVHASTIMVMGIVVITYMTSSEAYTCI